MRDFASKKNKKLNLDAIDGIIFVDKPKGITSADAVRFFQRLLKKYYSGLPTLNTPTPQPILNQGNKRIKEFFKLPERRVGHGGTLDPLATGILVIGIGNATKNLSSFLNGDKIYRTTGCLGFTTDTLDSEGIPSPLGDTKHITENLVKEALVRFEGTSAQEAPLYSAIKIEGKRLFEYARGSSKVEAGTEVHLPVREVTANKIELLKFWHEEIQIGDRAVSLPHFEISVHCEKGFYIRSLVRDIGIALKSSAHVRELRRHAQFPFTLDGRSYTFEDYLDIDVLKQTILDNKKLTGEL